ncbi:hypothetical protein HMPREF1548_05907 [Clostridium sp. KLE 1755]|nr:hypothetical protein HMPREF1548_05907 [Clostridium sp. KLE 1755]
MMPYRRLSGRSFTSVGNAALPACTIRPFISIISLIHSHVSNMEIFLFYTHSPENPVMKKFCP